MKNNQNNLKKGDYYIGLDIGTNSVGWAVSDTDYKIMKFKGNAMWGTRLFEEAQSAEERRGYRTDRRRLNRRKQRLALLELLFAEEILHIDSSFFMRLKESSLNSDDKKIKDNFLIFNDLNYTDKEYLNDYPTIYHLRSELVHSKSPHDIRLVFLALHHIIKNRGHFLFETDSKASNKQTAEQLYELNLYINETFGCELEIANTEEYCKILEDKDLVVTAKKKSLRKLVKNSETQEEFLNTLILSDMLSGATVKLSDLFLDDRLKNADIKSLSLKNDIDEIYDALSEVLGDRTDLILTAKAVFDSARLSQILNGEEYISDAKINLYNKNKNDLLKLKKIVNKYYPEKYKDIFVKKADKLNNYAAYSGNKIKSGGYSCNQESFCNYLKNQLKAIKNNPELADIYGEIENKTFLTRLTGNDNSIIPCQLNLKELEKILENAALYLPFLNKADNDGITVAQKIISIFKFRIPYYVGPLNEQSPHFWAVKSNEKIYPWNFNKVVNVNESAEKFIKNLIGRCSYTGNYVMPKNSLLYSEFMLRNEINLLRINGKELPRDVMDRLYDDLFVCQNKKVTKNSIKKYLTDRKLICETDEISGIDITVKSNLKSYHDFKRLLTNGLSKDDAEEIIRRIIIFGDDKKMLRTWLKGKHINLNDTDINYICRLKYKDWGRLSEQFLTEVYHIDKTGTALCIIDMLRRYNVNLNTLMSENYQFAAEAEKLRNENMGINNSLDKQIDDLYLSPCVKRSVRQTLKIIDEIVDIKKSAPKKIFIEVARSSEENKKRTASRKDKLIELYRSCEKESDYLFEKLINENENRLRSDKLYLYYTQFGKCMYSGDDINLEAMLSDNNTYDIDHIFPQSKVDDDSLNNKVLVKSVLNRKKADVYPIDETVRKNMYSFWKMLKDKSMISDKKFDRLVRITPLTDKELSDFVARQIVETQQSTKAIISLIKNYYPTSKIVFSKAKNVSKFRQQYDFIKCRDINNCHHAKDAYLNIVVGNVYDTKFTSDFFRNIHNETYSLNQVFNYDTKGAWRANGTSIETVKSQMLKNNITITRMPREVKGGLFDVTIMPAGKGQMPIKQGLSINKYGGYNKVSGAYFFVVEHTDKGKRIRTIESVMIYNKVFYEKEPLRYCEEVLGLCEPKIIAHKIRFDMLWELDGAKVYITGRTGNYYVCKHSYELAVDKEHERYIKQLGKYIERCTAAKETLAITSFDAITREKNIELYNWFAKKLNATVYAKLFKPMISDIEKNREVFENLEEYTQCKLLLEILKAFKCDRQLSDLSELCGKKKVGTILINKGITNLNSACVINQSPTGMYEHKIDLLK